MFYFSFMLHPPSSLMCCSLLPPPVSLIRFSLLSSFVVLIVFCDLAQNHIWNSLFPFCFTYYLLIIFRFDADIAPELYEFKLAKSNVKKLKSKKSKSQEFSEKNSDSDSEGEFDCWFKNLVRKIKSESQDYEITGAAQRIKASGEVMICSEFFFSFFLSVCYLIFFTHLYFSFNI